MGGCVCACVSRSVEGCMVIRRRQLVSAIELIKMSTYNLNNERKGYDRENLTTRNRTQMV